MTSVAVECGVCYESGLKQNTCCTNNCCPTCYVRVIRCPFCRHVWNTSAPEQKTSREDEENYDRYYRDIESIRGNRYHDGNNGFSLEERVFWSGIIANRFEIEKKLLYSNSRSEECVSFNNNNEMFRNYNNMYFGTISFGKVFDSEYFPKLQIVVSRLDISNRWNHFKEIGTDITFMLKLLQAKMRYPRTRIY